MDEYIDEVEEDELELEEESFNSLISAYAKENLKNVVAIKARKASLSGKAIVVECVVLTKNKKKSKLTVKLEGFKEKGSFKSNVKLGSLKTKPLILESLSINGTMKPRSLRVKGSKINESVTYRVASGKKRKRRSF